LEPLEPEERLEDFEPDFELPLDRAGEDFLELDLEPTLGLEALLEDPDDFFLLPTVARLWDVFGRFFVEPMLEEVRSRDRGTLLLLMPAPGGVDVLRLLVVRDRELIV